MFAHDLCHGQIEYFSLRLVDPAARRGRLSIKIEKTERSDTTNLQSSIFNSGLSGLGVYYVTSNRCRNADAMLV